MTTTAINTSPSILNCCESFFKCDETLAGDGTGAIVCSVTRAEFDPVAGSDLSIPVAGNYWLENAVGKSLGVRGYCANPVTVRNGDLPNFGRRSVILFACGRVYDASVIKLPFGNGGTPDYAAGTEGSISLSFGGGMHTSIRSATQSEIYIPPDATKAASLPAVGTDIGLIVEYTPKVGGVNGSVLAKAVDLNGNTFGAGAAETVQTATVTTEFDLNPSLNNKTRFAGLTFYSIMAFAFDNGLPANRADIYRWLMAQHSHGNRVLPMNWVKVA